MVPCERPVGMGFRSGIKDVVLFYNTEKQGWQDPWAPPLEEWKHWPTAPTALLRPETRNFQTQVSRNVIMFQIPHMDTKQSGGLHVPQELGWGPQDHTYQVPLHLYSFCKYFSNNYFGLFYFTLSALTLMVPWMLYLGQARHGKMCSEVPLTTPLVLGVQNIVI